MQVCWLINILKINILGLFFFCTKQSIFIQCLTLCLFMLSRICTFIFYFFACAHTLSVTLSQCHCHRRPPPSSHVMPVTWFPGKWRSKSKTFIFNCFKSSTWSSWLAELGCLLITCPLLHSHCVSSICVTVPLLFSLISALAMLVYLLPSSGIGFQIKSSIESL